MARPQKEILLAHEGEKTITEIIVGDSIYAVLYRGEAFNLRTLNLRLIYNARKYMRTAFTTEAPAINLARRLNTLFMTEAFTVKRIL